MEPYLTINQIIERYSKFTEINPRIFDFKNDFSSSFLIFELFKAANDFDPKLYTLEFVQKASLRIVKSSKYIFLLKLFNIIYLIIFSFLYFLFGSKQNKILFACKNNFSEHDLNIIARDKEIISVPFFRPGGFYLSSIFLRNDGSMKLSSLSSSLYYLEIFIVRFILKLLRVNEVVLKNSSSLGSHLIASAAQQTNIHVTILAHGYIADYLFLTIFPCLADRYLIWTQGQKVLMEKLKSTLPNLLGKEIIFESLNKKIPSDLENFDKNFLEGSISCAVIATQFYFDHDAEIIDNDKYFSELYGSSSKLTFFLHPADRNNSSIIERIALLAPCSNFASEKETLDKYDLVLISSISSLFDERIRNYGGKICIFPYDYFHPIGKSFIEIVYELEQVNDY